MKSYIPGDLSTQYKVGPSSSCLSSCHGVNFAYVYREHVRLNRTKLNQNDDAGIISYTSVFSTASKDFQGHIFHIAITSLAEV